ncbi:MAG: alpha/beta fold hydrolase [Planctomycetes bacterium]|nr:alpha/beta fold hydrolase [Planctomycetota bacterium]
MRIAWHATSLVLFCATAWTHEPEAIPVKIPSNGVVLSGTMLLPDEKGQFPCVVLAGGTMSHTRDGGLIDPQGRPIARDSLKRLAEKLAAGGYASLRWDKRGHGLTPAGPRPPEIEDDVADVISAIEFARRHPCTNRVIVAGESAGAYFACLASKQGYPADAYIFLGALCSDYESMYDYNYGRLKEYADQSPENLRWVEQIALDGLAIGEHYRQMFQAARRGDKSYTISHGEYKRTIGLERLRTQINVSISDQFRYIRGPALVLHGSLDLNVPPADAASAERIMKENGNQWVARVMIESADHSFQISPADPDTRIRERYSFDSFKRPYSEQLYSTLLDWLRKTIPTDIAAGGSRPRKPEPLRAGIIAWNGIQVIEEVTDAEKHPGVETLEGRIGPLLNGDQSQAHYIDMPPGLFLAEHPHRTESIIYGVRGRFVLCSGGRRQLIKAGSLLWFKADEATGWEFPFDEPAYILIFKGSRSEKSDGEFLDNYLLDETSGGGGGVLSLGTLARRTRTGASYELTGHTLHGDRENERRGAIAARPAWKFFVPFLSSCAVPSNNMPMQRTG